MKRVDALLADYGSYHRTPGNLACHCVGITLIIFGILSMLHGIRVFGFWTGSEVLIALALVYYLTLDVSLAAGTLVGAALLDALARAVGDWRVGAAAFLAGWIFQALGHAVYEKNSPAFLRNLIHLFVGPAFLVNEALRVRRPVQNRVAK